MSVILAIIAVVIAVASMININRKTKRTEETYQQIRTINAESFRRSARIYRREATEHPTDSELQRYALELAQLNDLMADRIENSM